jgi:hypothetical protein
VLSTKPIDASKLTFRYSGTAKHYTYDRDSEKRATDQTIDVDENGEGTGMPLWKVRCVAVYRKGGEHGEITVTVPADQAPTAEFDSEIVFSELTVKDWTMNGTQGQTWHADSFTATSPSLPPSATRATKKPEPASTG